MKIKIKDILPIIFSAVLAVGVMTIFKACDPMEDGTYMHCHDAQIGVFAIALILLTLSVVTLFVKNSFVQRIMPVAKIILSIIAVLIPGVINSMCMMNTMRCHAVMKPFVIIISICYIASVVFNTVMEMRDSKKEEQTA